LTTDQKVASSNPAERAGWLNGPPLKTQVRAYERPIGSPRWPDEALTGGHCPPVLQTEARLSPLGLARRAVFVPRRVPVGTQCERGVGVRNGAGAGGAGAVALGTVLGGTGDGGGAPCSPCPSMGPRALAQTDAVPSGTSRARLVAIAPQPNRKYRRRPAPTRLRCGACGSPFMLRSLGRTSFLCRLPDRELNRQAGLPPVPDDIFWFARNDGSATLLRLEINSLNGAEMAGFRPASQEGPPLTALLCQIGVQTPWVTDTLSGVTSSYAWTERLPNLTTVFETTISVPTYPPASLEAVARSFSPISGQRQGMV
jgi:hypothetical protein